MVLPHLHLLPHKGCRLFLQTSFITLSISLFYTVNSFLISCLMLSSSILVILFCFFLITLRWFLSVLSVKLGFSFGFPFLYILNVPFVTPSWGLPLPCDSRTLHQCNPCISISVRCLFFLCWYLPDLVWKEFFGRDSLLGWPPLQSERVDQ